MRIGRGGWGSSGVALIAALAGACGGGGGSTTSPVVPGASSIEFSPEEIHLDNPTSPGETTRGTSFTVEVTARDADGKVMTPSAGSPITVEVHGAPPGVITPEKTTLTSGSAVTLRYDGSYFANPISLVAWANQGTEGIEQAAADGTSTASLGRTQLLHQNQVACAYGSESYELAMACANPNDPSKCAEDSLQYGLKVNAAVGYDNPGSALKVFTVDTGSLGVLVPASELGPDAVGPGAPGKKLYNSSGNTYSGHYYLAPVSFQLADGSVVSTPPMTVLGVTDAYCAPGYKKCKKKPPTTDIHYLGIGFDRQPTGSEDEFDSPVDNAFLQVAASASDVSPGYILTGSAITVGMTSTAGFDLAKLTASQTTAGDWNTAPGCFAFPGLPEPHQFCGTLLLDVGIDGMFLDLELGERPQGSTQPGHPGTVRDQVEISILAGPPDAPAMSYQFKLDAGSPTGPAPYEAKWVNKPNVFVNTGRRPLAEFDYLYDARCGNVGFARCDGGSCR